VSQRHDPDQTSRPHTMIWKATHHSKERQMTKTQQVLIHLKKKPITSWEAITLYKATRLADIVYKLKLQGFKIYTVMVEGEKCRFARYFLKGKK
jgi:hypothetical protein